MMLVNRDGGGVPDVMAPLAELIADGFDAQVEPVREGDRRCLQVWPIQSSAFQVHFLSNLVTIKGTSEQNARVAVKVGRLAAERGVRLVAINEEGSHGHTLEPTDSATDLRDESSWRPIDPARLGRGDPFATTG